jgi:HSP20 family molecular chaperone IbpA
VRGGAFSRSFYLPANVEGAAAIAIMSGGVLTVRIPRRDAMFAA